MPWITSNIRYKAYFGTADAAYTPQLDDITLGYSGFPSSASLTSSKFDTAAANSFVSSIAWAEPGITAARDVKLQIRTSPDNVTWSNYCGPDNANVANCNSASYFTNNLGTGEPVDNIQIPAKWFQYQGTLTSTDGSGTATLDNINVKFDTLISS